MTGRAQAASKFRQLNLSESLQLFNLDPFLLLLVSIMLSLGLVMVFSATITLDTSNLDTNYKHLIRHLLHIFIGAALLLVTALISPEWVQKFSWFLMLFVAALLVIVLIEGIGIKINGSRRWLPLGNFSFQPSELMKITAVIFFANYLSKNQGELHRLKVWIIPCLLVLAPIGGLLLLEPDLGTLVVIVATVSIMLFLAGVSFRHFSICILAGAVGTGILIWQSEYRLARFTSYLDPWDDAKGSGFQLVQGLVAIGRGEWFGTGLGNSIQKLFYLPHASNDFLIAIIGEELGAVGIFFVLIIFSLFLWRAFAIARLAVSRGQIFSGLLAQGIGILISVQAAIHVGVNTGLLPTKGLTLPLMSFGGSSLLCSMIAIGLLMAIEKHCRVNPEARK